MFGIQLIYKTIYKVKPDEITDILFCLPTKMIILYCSTKYKEKIQNFIKQYLP